VSARAFSAALARRLALVLDERALGERDVDVAGRRAIADLARGELELGERLLAEQRSICASIAAASLGSLTCARKSRASARDRRTRRALGERAVGVAQVVALEPRERTRSSQPRAAAALPRSISSAASFTRARSESSPPRRTRAA
jgi:hypothetical protein